MNRTRALFLTGLTLSLSACVGKQAPVTMVEDCKQRGLARPICLFQNPEDLVALPEGDALIASEYAAPDGKNPGRISMLSLDREEHRILYPSRDEANATARPHPGWGDPSCPGPPPADFSPHGIHLSRRTDGGLQLLVVQHAGRESVEFLELTGTGTNRSLHWRGCVLAPPRAWLNAVAATPEGGFVSTSMMERLQAGEDEAVALHDDAARGYVVTWSPDEGLGRLAGGDGRRPNGIEISPDGRLVFLNSAGEGQVRRIVRATGEIEASAEISGLDNARWASDGRLVVSSIQTENDETFAACMALMSAGKGACPIGFRVFAIDPVTMESELLYQNAGPPMGGGTVGLLIGDSLFVGSFSGDRILRIELE